MNDLRKKVKLIKALQGITYREIAEYLEISPLSFYNWLNNQYDFSEQKELRLKEILSDLQEVNDNA